MNFQKKFLRPMSGTLSLDYTKLSDLVQVAHIIILFLLVSSALAYSLERQPTAIYHARRVALANKLNGGVALLFASNEPALEYQEYRQDEDFYYLTGWNEPGAALLIEASIAEHDQVPARAYREIIFLPIRDLLMERYTGVKLDASSPNAAKLIGVDEVASLNDLPTTLTSLAKTDRWLLSSVWTQVDVPQSKSSIDWIAITLGRSGGPSSSLDVRVPIMELRSVKDPGEVNLVRKATDASVAAQLAMIHAIKPDVSERAITGLLIEKLMEEGCERPSYPPIVGSGVNSTMLHYSANENLMKDGDVVVVDAAGEYSMYASDITRTLPVSGHFTKRQREIYDIVLGAQRAVEAAFVVGKSRENDTQHRTPELLDTVAWKYMNEHGKDLHGAPLGKYFIHGLGHSVGIDVHDPFDYSTPLGKHVVFTIEPGIYIPEEHLGVRIEDIYYVDDNGKLVQLTRLLPHTSEEVEAEMARK